MDGASDLLHVAKLSPPSCMSTVFFRILSVARAHLGMRHYCQLACEAQRMSGTSSEAGPHLSTEATFRL